MSLLKWKLIGGLLPFAAIVVGMRPGHPLVSVAIVGAAVIFANAVGYIEARKRKLEP